MSEQYRPHPRTLNGIRKRYAKRKRAFLDTSKEPTYSEAFSGWIDYVIDVEKLLGIIDRLVAEQAAPGQGGTEG